MINKETKVDRLVRYFKNNTLVVVIISLFIVVISIAKFTDSIDRIFEFSNKRLSSGDKDTLTTERNISNNSSPPIPNSKTSTMPLKDSGSDIMAQQEDKSLNIPLEPPIKKIKFNVSDIEDCPDEKTLQLAIGITKGIVSSISRDTAYRKIVDDALCSVNIETAMIAASRIISSISRGRCIYGNSNNFS